MNDELDALSPDVEVLELTTGFPLEIVRMQTRQFFRLLKVITHGAGPKLIQEGLDFEAAPEVFGARLMMIIAMSIPDAEQETIDFLQSVSQPSGLVGGLYGKQPSQMSKQELQEDNALWGRFREEMFNPDPMDTLAIIETLVTREAADVQALGKKLKAMLSVFTKTGQAEDQRPEEVPEGESLNSSAHSPRSSTSSATSTGGRTSRSSASRSAGSGSAPKQPAGDAGASK